jgi:RNA polymerase sigma-70 factor (sigma-E family)
VAGRTGRALDATSPRPRTSWRVEGRTPPGRSPAEAPTEMGVQVLSMVRTGTDADSFATVFHAHHRQAVRLAYLLCGDHHQAEDIVSDAFAKVYARWRKGEVADVGAYLRRAVVNETNSKLRRRYLERREAAKRSGDERGVRLVDEHAADHDQVWQAIQQLPGRQRQAVVLRYYEDLSEAQTAGILGCSVGTVKSQVSRGLARMQQLLGDSSAAPAPPSSDTTAPEGAAGGEPR